jgi:hypothetical protein
MEFEWTLPVQQGRFMQLWRTAVSVEGLAWRLGRPTEEVEAAAEHLRDAGADLARVPLTEQDARAMMFIRTWVMMGTRREVARFLGWTVGQVAARRNNLVRQGVVLHPMPHGTLSLNTH